MIKLMKLELQRVNLRTYLIADLILSCFILLFTYFVANVAQIENEAEFMNYGNIYQFSCVIGLLLFGTLSAVMSNNLVIKRIFRQAVSSALFLSCQPQENIHGKSMDYSPVFFSVNTVLYLNTDCNLLSY